MGKRNSSYTYPQHLIDEWDIEKNNGKLLTDFSTGSHYKGWWICKKAECGCLHSWPAVIKNRTYHDSRCPFCADGSTTICYHQSLEYLCPDLMKQWDYEKNTDLDPSKIMPGSTIIANWICMEAKCGCPHRWACQIRSRAISTDSREASGCSYCSPFHLYVCIHDSLEYNYPEIVKEWDYDKNGDLKPSEVSKASSMIVNWKCTKKGHLWPASVHSRVSSLRGCSLCVNKTEGQLLEWITKIFPQYNIEHQKKFSWCYGESQRYFPFDIYIKELNLIIELDGPQHFKQIANWKPPENTKKNDIYKMKLALDKNIRFIRITQELFRSKVKEMDKFLLPHINNKELKYIFICENNEYNDHKLLLSKEMKQEKE